MKQEEISKYLFDRSVEDFGDCIFAFCYCACDCTEGLAVFRKHKPIMHIPITTTQSLENIYLEAVKKAGKKIPALTYKNKMGGLQE